MEFIRGHYNLKPHHRGCVASIGNYDGVHLGHQAVVRQLLTKRQQIDLPATIVTFEPQPQEYFRPGIQARLTILREKLDLLGQYGIERVLCLRFNSALAAMSAESFVQDILVCGLGVKHLVVGDDFRFGHGRIGDFAFLQDHGERFGFSVDHTDTHMVEGERVSSTRVRYALDEDQFSLTEQLLGRPYSISGRVAHGDKLGRQWGFPTANINMQRRLPPPFTGIFVVEVDGLTEHALPGVASLGVRPTLDSRKMWLEVHLLKFDQEIYGRRIQVRFLEKLRDEEKFDDVEALKQQIAKDTSNAQQYFAARDS